MPTQVLIADPDRSSCDALARNLASWGYEAVVATNGTDAWGILQKPNAPKIALFDSALQGVNALELCQLVRDMRGDNSFVLVFDGSGTSTVEALEAGADGVIAKPVHMRELRVRLAAGMRGRRLAASDAPSTPAQAPLSTKDPADRALVGRVVAGKYRIERLIGKGGMGTVWKGTHLTLGTTVAIKFIKGEYARHDLARARFSLEARSAARVQTKYAVKVFDYGVTEGGMPYIVMEYLAGPSLMDHVRAAGPLSFAETVTLIAQVAHALEQLHAFGTIHRDVKPDNILLVQDPDAPHGKKRRVAKIIDFGVAKVLATTASDGEGNAVSTQQGIVIGTPNYMPPELLTGQEDPNVGADVWALAACAFTAMTGRIPFEGGTLPDVVKAVCRKPAPTPSRVEPNVPAEFDAWFARACSRDPAKRFRSARELARALTEAHADYTDAGLEMTPSLKSFISLPAPPLAPPRDLAAAARPTVRPPQVRVFDLESPTLAFS